VGGIARFQTVVNHYRSSPEYDSLPHLLTFFSGDSFNPSLESSITKGKHMVPVLNGIGTVGAVIHRGKLHNDANEAIYPGCGLRWRECAKP
jgi:hypothetical protein